MRFKSSQWLRDRRAKWAFELIILILIFLAVKLYLQRDLVSGEAPPLGGTLLKGRTVSLETYRGEPLLLHFWATWCRVCRLEQGSIDNISKDHTVLTVAMNSGPASDVGSYLREHNLDFPVLVDEHGTLARRYGVSGVPTSFIINPSGEIAYTEVGYTTAWGLRFRLWLAGD
jgi:peroxiredoxin